VSLWIQTASAASKQIRGGLPPFKIVLVVVVILGSVFPFVSAQAQPTSKPAVDSGEIRTLPTADTDDRIRQRNARGSAPTALKNFAKNNTCLLPPLNLMSGPTVAAEQLQIPPKARKEYEEACATLKNGKTGDAEKRLRKAVQEYPKYSAAWVTLGQVLAAQQRTDEARSACSQASTVDSRYVPAYLCLADIALRANDWREVLHLSSEALEVDPSNNAVAYEYHAAANLNLHNLGDAEKSGLRAVDIDKNHREPRVYFVLAQIYEAKHDPANEATQLREYLKYARNPDDVDMVKQYLSDLEKQTGK
jgi:tetratricopeptide (TPR) repeat protein